MSSAQVIRLNLKDFKKVAETPVEETIDVQTMETLTIQEEPKPQFLSITDFDLDSIKKEAFDQGYKKAKAEAKVELEHALTANQEQLLLIEGRFSETTAMLSDELAMIEDEAAKLAYKLVGKLIYEESELMEKRIRGFFESVFQRLKDQGKIVIKMKPEIFTNYGKIIQELAQKHQLALETVSSEDAEANVTVNWQHGHLEFIPFPKV
ncbi:MAG: hypothetical protein ACHP6I_01075 [Rickettsiales bacterium]